MGANRDDAFDPIPAPIREILGLFDEALSHLRFPDVDADVLAALSAEVRARADEVGEARARLAAAREALEASQAVLVTHARKAVDYALVYAKGDEALTQELEALSVVQAEEAPSKPRRRRRKAAREDAAPAPERVRAAANEALPLVAGPSASLAAPGPLLKVATG